MHRIDGMQRWSPCGRLWGSGELAPPSSSQVSQPCSHVALNIFSGQRLCKCLGARAFPDERAKRRPMIVAACAGNLLAPWAAATATGVLRSAYSRVQLPRLRKRRMELLGKLKVCACVICFAPPFEPLHCIA